MLLEDLVALNLCFCLARAISIYFYLYIYVSIYMSKLYSNSYGAFILLGRRIQVILARPAGICENGSTVWGHNCTIWSCGRG